jgi:hypothetical protein
LSDPYLAPATARYVERSNRAAQSINRKWEITPKAFANVSPGFELARTLGINSRIATLTLKGFDGWRNPFGVVKIFNIRSQGCRFASNPGLKLANAFGVFLNYLVSNT